VVEGTTGTLGGVLLLVVLDDDAVELRTVGCALDEVFEGAVLVELVELVEELTVGAVGAGTEEDIAILEADKRLAWDLVNISSKLSPNVR